MPNLSPDPTKVNILSKLRLISDHLPNASSYTLFLPTPIYSPCRSSDMMCIFLRGQGLASLSVPTILLPFFNHSGLYPNVALMGFPCLPQIKLPASKTPPPFTMLYCFARHLTQTQMLCNQSHTVYFFLWKNRQLEHKYIKSVSTSITFTVLFPHHKHFLAYDSWSINIC